jgi:hypothetical protein
MNKYYFIKPDEIASFLRCEKSKAYNVIANIKACYGSSPRNRYVRLSDFCDYHDLSEIEVNRFLVENESNKHSKTNKS